MSSTKTTKELQSTMKVIVAADATKFERVIGLGLLVFGAVPLVMSWVRLFRSESDMPTWITLTVLGLYSFCVIETISMIFLKGLRRIDLSDKTMHWLGGTALVEVAPMVWYIIKRVV